MQIWNIRGHNIFVYQSSPFKMLQIFIFYIIHDDTDEMFGLLQFWIHFGKLLP